MQTQTFEVLRVPLDAVYTVGPGKNSSRSPQPASRQDFLLCYFCAWGAAPGGGAAAAAAGAWGVEVYGVCDGVLHAYSDGGGGGGDL